MKRHLYEPKKLTPIEVARGFGDLNFATRHLCDAMWLFKEKPAAYKEGGIAYEWAKEALRNGAPANMTLWPKMADDKGFRNSNTVLHFAAENGYHELAELLIHNGADKNALNQNAQTPLMLAIENGKLLTAQMLMDNGANVNRGGAFEQDNDEFIAQRFPLETALHIAMTRTDKDYGGDVGSAFDIVKGLMQNGADFEMSNGHQTAWEYGNEMGGDKKASLYLELQHLTHDIDTLRQQPKDQHVEARATYITDDLYRRLVNGKTVNGTKSTVRLPESLTGKASVLEAMLNCAQVHNVAGFVDEARNIPKNMADDFARGR